MEEEDYDAVRARNIAQNKAILASLGLEKPASEILGIPKSAKSTPKKAAARRRRSGVTPRRPAISKRKFDDIVGEDDGDEGEVKRRRSRRLSMKGKTDYTKEKISVSMDSDDEFIDDDSDFSGGEVDGERSYRKSKEKGFLVGVVGGRTVRKFASNVNRGRANGKYYGAPPVPVGKWWAQRSECARDDVHGPWVAGIHGDPENGAYSVALSGGYEDDVDEGFRFTFTGEGGRDLKGTKAKPKNLRTAPQSKDQSLTKGNAALFMSSKNGKPVRVVRGFKGKSKWAPKEGYRYDGLYKVCKAWMDTGASGFKVWKFAFKRLDGQPPIDLKAGPQKDADDEDGSDSGSGDNDIESVAGDEEVKVEKDEEEEKVKAEKDEDTEDEVAKQINAEASK